MSYFRFNQQNIIETIHNILAAIQTRSVEKIEIDWSACNEISHDWICSYLNFNREAESKGISIEHCQCEGNDSFYLMKQVLSFPANDPVHNNFSSGFYITAVKGEEETRMRAGSLKNYFLINPQLQELDLSPVETLFSELYMNVCQHAENENGFVYVSGIQENGNFSIYIADLGVGIPDKIRAYFDSKEFPTDADCIRYATNDFVTTKSTLQNYGRGLNTLVTSVKELRGKTEIRSSNGIYKIKANGEEERDSLPYYHIGTLITISLNFSNFEPKPEGDYTENIDF